MIKKFVLVLLTLSGTVALHAQLPKAYLNGFAGYTFDEKFDVGGYAGKIKGAAHYGGSIEMVMAGASTRYNERTLELSYQASPSTIDGYRWNGITYVKDMRDIGVNYVMLGGNNYFGKTRKAMGFGGVSAGVGWANDKKSSSTVTKFAMGIKAGGRFMFSDRVGLKLYGQMNTIIGGIGGGFYFGTGGPSVGVSTYSTIFQFGLGGGLTVGLGGATAAK